MQSSMYSGILEILKKSLKINQKWQLLLQEISVNNKRKAKFIVKLRFKSMKKISNFWPKVSFYCWIIIVGNFQELDVISWISYRIMFS